MSQLTNPVMTPPEKEKDLEKETASDPSKALSIVQLGLTILLVGLLNIAIWRKEPTLFELPMEIKYFFLGLSMVLTLLRLLTTGWSLYRARGRPGPSAPQGDGAAVLVNVVSVFTSVMGMLLIAATAVYLYSPALSAGVVAMSFQIHHMKKNRHTTHSSKSDSVIANAFLSLGLAAIGATQGFLLWIGTTLDRTNEREISFIELAIAFPAVSLLVVELFESNETSTSPSLSVSNPVAVTTSFNLEESIELKRKVSEAPPPSESTPGWTPVTSFRPHADDSAVAVHRRTDSLRSNPTTLVEVEALPVFQAVDRERDSDMVATPKGESALFVASTSLAEYEDPGSRPSSAGVVHLGAVSETLLADIHANTSARFWRETSLLSRSGSTPNSPTASGRETPISPFSAETDVVRLEEGLLGTGSKGKVNKERELKNKLRLMSPTQLQQNNFVGPLKTPESGPLISLNVGSIAPFEAPPPILEEICVVALSLSRDPPPLPATLARGSSTQDPACPAGEQPAGAPASASAQPSPNFNSNPTQVQESDLGGQAYLQFLRTVLVVSRKYKGELLAHQSLNGLDELVVRWKSSVAAQGTPAPTAPTSRRVSESSSTSAGSGAVVPFPWSQPKPPGSRASTPSKHPRPTPISSTPVISIGLASALRFAEEMSTLGSKGALEDLSQSGSSEGSVQSGRQRGNLVVRVGIARTVEAKEHVADSLHDRRAVADEAINLCRIATEFNASLPLCSDTVVSASSSDADRDRETGISSSAQAPTFLPFLFTPATNLVSLAPERPRSFRSEQLLFLLRDAPASLVRQYGSGLALNRASFRTTNPSPLVHGSGQVVQTSYSPNTTSFAVGYSSATTVGRREEQQMQLVMATQGQAQGQALLSSGDVPSLIRSQSPAAMPIKPEAGSAFDAIYWRTFELISNDQLPLARALLGELRNSCFRDSKGELGAALLDGSADQDKELKVRERLLVHLLKLIVEKESNPTAGGGQ